MDTLHQGHLQSCALNSVWLIKVGHMENYRSLCGTPAAAVDSASLSADGAEPLNAADAAVWDVAADESTGRAQMRMGEAYNHCTCHDLPTFHCSSLFNLLG